MYCPKRGMSEKPDPLYNASASGCRLPVSRTNREAPSTCASDSSTAKSTLLIPWPRKDGTTYMRLISKSRLSSFRTAPQPTGVSLIYAIMNAPLPDVTSLDSRSKKFASSSGYRRSSSASSSAINLVAVGASTSHFSVLILSMGDTIPQETIDGIESQASGVRAWVDARPCQRPTQSPRSYTVPSAERYGRSPRPPSRRDDAPRPLESTPCPPR